MRRRLVVLLFFLSGAAALAYQVAWTRHLVLVFGNTTRAVSLILAAYMLGLALGSEVGGRLADRAKRPVLWYAAFEAAIGLFALLFPWLVDAVRSAYLALGTAASPVLFGGAFLVLLVPTFLMGTTLPLLVRATVDDPRRTGGDVGLLYGMNTVGAVVGAAVTGFFLMEAAGVLGATRWAAAVNLLIGALGLVVPRLPTRPRPPPPESAVRSGPTRPPAASAALVAVFAGGLVGLSAEVVWTRLLVFFLQGFTYTFSAMLAMFLLGLALGSHTFGRVALRTTRPAVVMGRLQLLVGVAAALVLLLLTHHFEATRAVWGFVGESLGIDALRVRHVVTLLLASGIVLLPPAFLMGGVFPLAAAVFGRGLDDLGVRIGRLYAVNTIGAVGGSLLAGFVLAPLVGPAWSAVVVAVVGLAAGVVVLRLAGEGRRAWFGWSVVATAAVAVLLVAARPDVPFLLRSHVFAGERGRENRLRETREGVVCEVSVVENERDDYHLLYTDEFQAAGTRPEYRYMRMLAHLPIALARDPERALVICYGTGTTCGSVVTHPSIHELDIVEISPEVLAVAHYFDDVNGHVLEGAGRDDLTVRVHVDDGRNFVLRSREQWDVISLEPLMPYTPAAIHFYTEDFYRECRPRLSPGGTMCQWIPLHAMSPEHLAPMISAFVNVFPGAVMFHVDGAVALIGGTEPIVLDDAQITARLGVPSVRADLARVGYDDPARALATFAGGGDVLAAFADVPPMTDEHPLLEFHPLPLNVQFPHLGRNLMAIQEMRRKHGELPVVGVDDPDVADRYHTAWQVNDLLLEGAVHDEETRLLLASKQAGQAVATLTAARHAYSFAAALDPDDPAARRAFGNAERSWWTTEAVNHLREGDADAAVQSLDRAAHYPTERRRDLVPTLRAEALNRLERFDEALAAATEAVGHFPRGMDACAERAYSRAALGDLAGARRDYTRALAGEAPDVLTPRLRADAERVLAQPVPDDPRPLGERIEAALLGEGVGRVPAHLVLRILAGDEPTGFAAHFAPDLATLADPTRPGADRMLALKRVELGAPDGAVALLLAVTDEAEGGDVRLHVAAASALGTLAPERLPDVLAAVKDPAVLVAAATAASRHGVAAAAPALFRLLQDDREDVRRAAHTALFALADGDVPGLARLDVTAYPSRAYSDTVDDIEDRWRRTRGLGPRR